MKPFNYLLISLLFISSFVLAQSNDEAEIRRLERYWTELLDKGDTTTLLGLWSENYVVNNPYGNIVTPEDIVALMKSGHVFPAVERIIETITFNRDIAIVMGKELQQPANMTPDHKEWIPRRFTNVWIKTTDGWKLAARQSSVICAD
jgi:ketosteroid isomerase-like protein